MGFSVSGWRLGGFGSCGVSIGAAVRATVRFTSQRVQVSLWYILIGYFGGLSLYHNDTWTLWALCYYATDLL